MINGLNAGAQKRQLRIAFCATLVAVRMTHAVFAQEPPAATLSVRTQLVKLDVTVNDAAGHPVLDLGKDDFKVTENGVPQRIRYFATPLAHRMPSSTEVVHSSADLSKIGDAPVSILVLDEINTPFVDMALARGALDRYLKAQPEVFPEPTALFFISNSKLDVIQDYTQSKQSLLAAFKKHFPEYPWQLSVNAGDMAIYPRMSRTLGSLLQIAEATRGVQGRKNVIWVGQGFPSLDVSEAQPDAIHVITEAIKKTTLALLQAQVSLFTIDPATLDTAQVIDQESASADTVGDLNGTGLVFRGNIQFTGMAGTTGGHAFSMNNFIDQEIASSVSDGYNYYDVAYSPGVPSNDTTRYRKIKVTVSRPGLTVITRDGYFPEAAGEGLPIAEASPVALDQVRFDLSSAAMSKMVYDGLSVIGSKDNSSAIAVSVDAAGLGWRDETKGHVAELSVMVVCFSAKDKPLYKGTSEHTANTAGDISKVSGRLNYKLPIELPSGTVRVRVVVRDLVSGKIGSSDISLR